MFRKTKSNIRYIDARTEQASTEIGNALEFHITNADHLWTELVFLCIGSDRITGDCLGPLIGQQLKHVFTHACSVYGSLDYPVHALNLSEVLKDIQYMHPKALVVAIDASLGSLSHQGFVCIGKGAILPGAGVSKELPAVGDIFITGIVNLTGSSPHLLLSSTRLSDVMQMAESISKGILEACCRQEELNKEYRLRRVAPAT